MLSFVASNEESQNGIKKRTNRNNNNLIQDEALNLSGEKCNKSFKLADGGLQLHIYVNVKRVLDRRII